MFRSFIKNGSNLFLNPIIFIVHSNFLRNKIHALITSQLSSGIIKSEVRISSESSDSLFTFPRKAIESTSNALSQ